MGITTQDTDAALTGRQPQGRNMPVRIRLRSGTIIDGEHVDAGSVIVVGMILARQLIHAGKAIPAADAPEKPTTREKPPASKKKGTQADG